MKTGIIIPCYNEENRLNVNAFMEFANKKNQYHLCFVNDGSSDDTITVLKKIQETNPRKISIVDVKRNAGKASAVRSGAQYLYSRGDIRFIGFIDADLSTDFEDFGSLLQTLKNDEKLDFVFGSRAKNVSKAIEKDKVRGVISKMINLLIVAILGLFIQDTQCGAKVFRAHLVPVLFERKFYSRWLFDVEMFLKLKKFYGKSTIMTKILEQPLKRWVHMEDSKLGLKDSLEIPYRLLSIWFNYSVLQSNVTINAKNSMEPGIEIFGVNSTNLAA